MSEELSPVVEGTAAAPVVPAAPAVESPAAPAVESPAAPAAKKPGVSPARNAIGLIVLLAVVVVGVIQYRAMFQYNAVVSEIDDRLKDETKPVLSQPDAENIIGRESDDGGTVVNMEGRSYNKKTYTWSGVLKSYPLTAYYTQGSDPILHHIETEGQKYTPEPAPLAVAREGIASASTDPVPPGTGKGSGRGGRTKKGGGRGKAGAGAPRAGEEGKAPEKVEADKGKPDDQPKPPEKAEVDQGKAPEKAEADKAGPGDEPKAPEKAEAGKAKAGEGAKAPEKSG